MDLYGHNPFSARTPKLSQPPLGNGYADISDLDTLAKWLDRNLRRKNSRVHSRRLRLFLSEVSFPTDHSNVEFNFYHLAEDAGRLDSPRAADHAPLEADLHVRLPRPAMTIRCDRRVTR